MALWTSSWRTYGSGAQWRLELEIDDPPADGLVSLVDARLSRMVSDARRQARQRDGLGVH